VAFRETFMSLANGVGQLLMRLFVKVGFLDFYGYGAQLVLVLGGGNFFEQACDVFGHSVSFAREAR
jgi:hypothetical protein